MNYPPDYGSRILVSHFKELTDEQLAFEYYHLQCCYKAWDDFPSDIHTPFLIEYLDCLEDFISQEICNRFVNCCFGMDCVNYPIGLDD